MTDSLAQSARRVAVLACFGWGVVVALLMTRTTAHIEYALATHEARAVAVSIGPSLQPGRLPVRIPVASGRLVNVVSTMVRLAGPTARRIETSERSLVFGRLFDRYVSVPIKDADQWDVVGAVVLRAEWWRGLWPLLGVAIVAAFVAALLAWRGVTRAADGGGTAPFALVAEVIAVLAAATLALMVLVQRFSDGATRLFPTESAVTRFDPLWRALPSLRIVVVSLLVLFLCAGAGIVGAAFLASTRRPLAERRETLTAWRFLAPSALHLAAFTLGPLVFTSWLSLHQWDLLEVARPFVGLANYRQLWADPQFWNALRNTAVYSLYVPVTMGLALGAAMLLNQRMPGVRVLRAMVFLPTVVSYVAIAMVWQWMYHADYGVLNFLIRLLGGSGVDWLGNPSTALVALMVVSAWVQLGYQMIVYLAGLQGIPETLHEAARLDGASAWQRFIGVTWPLLRPVSLYLLVTGVIWSFQVFALVYVMTEGGPTRSTDVLVYQIYQQAWEFRRMGYASAMSWVLFAILVGLTLLQWRFLNRKVEYAS